MPSQLALPTEKVTWTIKDFVDLHHKGKLVVNEEYQRSEVWNLHRKQLLVDSILCDYDIGSVILRQNEDKWEILDGQQRLKAIFDFVEDKFCLSPEVPDEIAKKKWSQLGPEVQWGQFMVRKVYTTKLYSVDDETTARIFLRVQEGMPLNSAEKLNAMRGAFRNKVVETSQHIFFRQTKVSSFRFSHRYLCAQIALQEIDNGIVEHVFKDAKFRNLKGLYERYKTGLPPGIFERLSSTLNFLQKALGTGAQVISEKSDLLTAYTLASYVVQKFVVKDREDKFKDFIVDFFVHVAAAKAVDAQGYYEYWVARSSSPDSKKQIDKRFRTALQKLLEYDSTMEPKDVDRGFDWGQKLAIYGRAYREARGQGKEEAACKICGLPTPLNSGEPDHIRPHDLGGPTTVENGQWTCRTCNRAKGNKYDGAEP